MSYATVLVFFAFAVVFAAGGIITSLLLMPRHPNPVKNSSYECGLEPIGDAKILYSVRFYVFALMYVIFAVDAALLIPWAVVYSGIRGWAVFFEALLFISVLALALAYAWKKGELKWD